jgi:hypothetical protein
MTTATQCCVQGVVQGSKNVTEQKVAKDQKSQAYTAADGKMAATAVPMDVEVEDGVAMADVSDKELKSAKERCVTMRADVATSLSSKP